MKIKVNFDGRRISVEPERARIAVGDTVEWVCTGVGSQGQEWILDFAASSPFHGVAMFRAATRSVVRSAGPFAMEHQAASILTAAALNAGTHKYDVKVRDQSSGELLADEDPWIIVR